jgi:hypothetical protein
MYAFCVLFSSVFGGHHDQAVPLPVRQRAGVFPRPAVAGGRLDLSGPAAGRLGPDGIRLMNHTSPACGSPCPFNAPFPVPFSRVLGATTPHRRAR